jgi:hypothetical protein
VGHDYSRRSDLLGKREGPPPPREEGGGTSLHANTVTKKSTLTQFAPREDSDARDIGFEGDDGEAGAGEGGGAGEVGARKDGSAVEAQAEAGEDSSAGDAMSVAV